MADAEDADAATSKPVESSEVEMEMEAEAEVETDVKEEDAAEGKSDNGDSGAAETNGDEPAVSVEQYKALKNITDILNNHKIKIKGDESVHSILAL